MSSWLLGRSAVIVRWIDDKLRRAEQCAIDQARDGSITQGFDQPVPALDRGLTLRFSVRPPLPNISFQLFMACIHPW